MTKVSFIKDYEENHGLYYPYYLIENAKHYVSRHGKLLAFHDKQDAIDFINEDINED